MNRILSLTGRFLSVCLTLVLAAFVFGNASQAQAACSITYSGNSFTVSGCPSDAQHTITRFNGPSCPTTQTKVAQFNTGNEKYDPQPPMGQCQQVDHNFGSDDGSVGSGGVCSCNGTTGGGGGGKACGETCTQNSDCRNPSGNGSPVACVQGTCQNTMCAVGMTIPGGNCSCGSNVRKCGQICNGTVGLCGPNQGTCTYVNPPKHWYTNQPDCKWGWGETYCAGNQNGYSHVQCPATDTGDGGGTYLRNPAGLVNGIVSTEIAKSCQVCGNGEVEVGEECDLGTNNGKPGYDCTAVTCKKVACNKVCATDADCGAQSHTVDVYSSLTAGQDWVFDYFLDNGVYIEAAPALSIGGGAMSVNTDSAPHGGSYLYSTLNGVRAGFKTTSSSVILRTFKAATRGNMIVYVDGQQKQVITGLNTGTFGWTDITIQVGTANQYTCYNSGTSKNCRLPSNPTSATCSSSTPPPTPSPTPVVTPSPLACTLTPTFTSTGNASAWKYGDMIKYTLPAAPSSMIPVGGSVRYEGEAAAYRNGVYVKTTKLTPVNATASQFSPMKVDVANSTYYFRFRFCVKTSAGVETCTAWGNWAAPATTATATPATAAPTIAPGTSHVVKFVNKVATGRTTMVVDAIKEGTTYVENNSARLTYVGTWGVASDSSPSGGSYSATQTNGNSVSITTTQSTLYYRTYRYATRSDVSVYVDGVLKTTLTGLNTGSGWVDLPINF